jgi:predicted XRE-type DNA-binding protein
MGSKRLQHYSNYIKKMDNGCWHWMWTLTINGYAAYGKIKGFHIFLYEQKYGPVPDGLELGHSCRTRHCVNPDHVRPITHTINMREANHIKVSEQIVEEIRRIYVQGNISQRVLAGRYGISQQLVSNILRNKAWVLNQERINAKEAEVELGAGIQ